MTTYIGGVSALQYLLNRGTSERYMLTKATHFELEPVRSIPKPKPIDNNKLALLGRPAGIYTPSLEVNVMQQEYRSKASLITSHVWTGPARGTYLKIDNEYRVLTPEAVFAQLSACLDLVHLVELGITLCSSYSPGGSYNETRYDLEALTTVEKLSAYISKLERKKGLKKAKSALRYIRNGSASPVESKVATALLLPCRHGGYQTKPLLNVEIELAQEAKGLGFNNCRKPDFLWPNQQISLEYDSREWHDETQQYFEDEQRRNELAAMGINGFIMRPWHISTRLAFESIVSQVKYALNEPFEGATKGLAEKRSDVFELLFGRKQWKPMDIR